MKPVLINELCIYNAGRTVYCHPDNYYKIKKQVDFIEDKDHIPEYIFRPNSIQIRTNNLLEKERQNGWMRNNSILPDHPFVTFVEDHELIEPQSWQIFFGLVVPKIEPLVYIVNDSFFRLNHDLPFVHPRAGVITNSV